MKPKTLGAFDDAIARENQIREPCNLWTKSSKQKNKNTSYWVDRAIERFQVGVCPATETPKPETPETPETPPRKQKSNAAGHVVRPEIPHRP
jgi:hypothetical protein